MIHKPGFHMFFIFSIIGYLGILAPAWSAPPLPSPDTPPATRMIHGSLDTYKGEGIVLAWGILKNSQGKGPEADRIVLRILSVSKDWEALLIEGIDPFSGSRGTIFSALFPLGPLDLSLPRSHFDSFPRTEIHFFRSYQDLQDGKPNWTLYFVGVPDTTPEFLSAEQLMNHLEKILR